MSLPDGANQEVVTAAERAARQFGIPPQVMFALGTAESGLTNRGWHKLHPDGTPDLKDGYGPFGMTVGTAASLGFDRNQVQTVDGSAAAAAKYLSQLYDKYGNWQDALMGYRGPGYWDAVKAGRVQPGPIDAARRQNINRVMAGGAPEGDSAIGRTIQSILGISPAHADETDAWLAKQGLGSGKDTAATAPQPVETMLGKPVVKMPAAPEGAGFTPKPGDPTDAWIMQNVYGQQPEEPAPAPTPIAPPQAAPQVQLPQPTPAPAPAVAPQAAPAAAPVLPLTPASATPSTPPTLQVPRGDTLGVGEGLADLLGGIKMPALSAALHPNDPAAQAAAQEASIRQRGAGEALGRGLTGGWLDRGIAAVKAYANGTTTRDELGKILSAYQQTPPDTRLQGELVGGALGSALLPAGKSIPAAAGIALGSGVAAGAGLAPPGQEISGGITGGAAVTAASALLGMGSLGARAADWLFGSQTPAIGALQQLRTAMVNKGLTPGSTMTALDRQGGPSMIADATGVITKGGGIGSDIAQDALQTRAATGPSRLEAIATEPVPQVIDAGGYRVRVTPKTTGSARTDRQDLNAAVTAARKQAGAAAEKAISANPIVPPDAIPDTVWSNPYVQKAVDLAKGSGIPADPTSLRYLDAVYTRLNAVRSGELTRLAGSAMGDRPPPAGAAVVARDVGNAARDLRAAISNAAPDWGKAKALAAEPAEMQEATYMGTNILRRDAAAIDTRLQSMHPMAQQAFSVAAAEAITKQVQRSGFRARNLAGLPDDVKAQLQVALGTPDKFQRFTEEMLRQTDEALTLRQANARAGVGSTEGATSDISQSTMRRLGLNLREGVISGIADMVRGSLKHQKLSSEQERLLGQMITTTDPQEQAGILAAVGALGRTPGEKIFGIRGPSAVQTARGLYPATVSVGPEQPNGERNSR